MAEKKITTYEQRSEHEIPYLPPGKDIKGVSVQNHDCTKCGRASFLGCLVGCEQNRDEVPSLSLILVHSVIYLVNGQIKSHFFNRCRFCWSTATFGCCDRTNPRCYTGFSAKEDWSKYESFRVRGITYVDKEDPWYERLSDNQKNDRKVNIPKAPQIIIGVNKVIGRKIVDDAPFSDGETKKSSIPLAKK